jgi:hypothetical protein
MALRHAGTLSLVSGENYYHCAGQLFVICFFDAMMPRRFIDSVLLRTSTKEGTIPESGMRSPTLKRILGYKNQLNSPLDKEVRGIG